MINFVFEQPGYPNLAQPGLTTSEFDTVVPRSIPFRLLQYLDRFNIPWQSHTPSTAPNGSWYPVGLGWYDSKINYPALMSHNMIHLVKKGRVKMLIYYHESDSPGQLKNAMDFAGEKIGFPKNYYLFVSSNTAAEHLENFMYFPDHELFFNELNKNQSASVPTAGQRPWEFTALNRTHKRWRATVMADLHRSNLLNQSLWSYNTQFLQDPQDENPIDVPQIRGLEEYMELFLERGPYYCDGSDHSKHNDHRSINVDLYTQSYCHIVIETLFDIEQSGGAFLTEKTFKAIKYGQPFVIVGAVGSLDALRRAGYRTFDHAIDNRYDLIYDNVQRWLAVKRAIAEIKSQNMQQWHERCIEDAVYNQQHFLRSRSIWLDRLATHLDTV